MLCQSCGKAEPAMRITRIVNGSVEELHVCEDCAARVSPYHAKLAKKKQVEKLSVENLLKDLLAQQEAAMSPEKGALVPVKPDALACPTCRLDYQRYKQTYMLGCPDCYDAFGDRLLIDLKKIHGAVEHVGDYHPAARVQDVAAMIMDLREELDDAVQNEDFERAAQLRDQIRKLQEKSAAG